MDVGQSSQTGILSASDLVSPSKVNRTRTVREYEQTISELKKENFDLKLRVFMLEEEKKKNFRKDKGCSSPEKDNTVEIIVQLKVEIESLCNELSQKEKLLQVTLDRAEKWENEYKELEKKYAELQLELASLSELPSKQEFVMLCEEKENLLKENESFKRELAEKTEEIDILNQRLEILSDKNNILEEKLMKRSLTIRSFVDKNIKEKEMLPDGLRNIVISAAQAAKNRNKEDLAVAVKSFSVALSQIMASPLKTSLSESEEKENISSSQAKCLKEEFLEKSNVFLASQSESCTELNRIQNLKEVLAERNSSISEQLINLDSVYQDSYVRGKILNENSVDVAEKDVIDFINYSSSPFCAAENKSAVSHSSIPTTQQCSFSEHSLINFRDIVSPVELSQSKQHSKIFPKDSVSSCSKEHLKVMKENEQLKIKLEENHAVIQGLRATCEQLEQRKIHLEESQYEVPKVTECFDSCVQTDIGGNELLQLYETAKMKKDVTLSDNIDELREDILMLLLAIEGKNKELTDVKETLSVAQADLKNVMNSSKSEADKDYLSERNELHERLAFTCSVNEELVKHLRNLEAFMEDLLQHKFDSSMESIGEKSDFLSNVSRCLNESLKLSNVLSDHLSICEGSKLFEVCESFLGQTASYSDEKSLPHLDVSEFNVPEYHLASNQSSACRRLFMKESIKTQDFALEKYYFILAEKFSRLQSLLRGLENTKDGEISDNIWNKLNEVVTSLSGALQKLQNAKEHSKSLPPADCGRCVMLDLLMDLKTFHNEFVNHTLSSRHQSEILQQIWREIDFLKEDCEEPFSLFLTKSDKISKSTQSESFSANESSKSIQTELSTSSVDKLSKSTQSNIVSESDQMRVNKLEKTVLDLSIKNRNLMENLNEMNDALMKEQIALESVKAENLMLSSQVNNLKDELSEMKCKKRELATENADLLKKLTSVKEENSDLNNTLKDLEEKRNECNIVLDRLTAELQKNKSDLESMNIKCIQCEQELNKQIRLKETYEEKFKNLEVVSCNEKENFLNQIKNLTMEKDDYAQRLLSVQEKVKVLEKENSGLNNDLNVSRSELGSLQEVIVKHENTNKNLNIIYTEVQKELENTNKQLQNLKEQYNLYVKDTTLKLKSIDEYQKQLKKLEAKSLSEGKKLGNEISRLNAERDDILQKLKDEQNYSEKLMLEKTELNQKLLESCQQITSLQQSNKELKNIHLNLRQENELIQNALASSNSKCDALSNDLRQIRETLQNLENRCAAYEKELVASAGMKDNLVECLLNINHEFSINRQKLNEICKAYDHRSTMDLDDTYASDFIPVIDEDHVKSLCENVDSESKKLLKSVDVLLEILKNFQLKSQELKSAEEKYLVKDTNLKKIEFLSLDFQHLTSQKDHLERIIGEQQKSLIESQKSVKFSSFEIQNLKGKLQEAEKEIEKERALLKLKEDEITVLQERIFNLLTDINRIKDEKADLLQKRPSFQDFFDIKVDSPSLYNSLLTPQCGNEVTLQEATQTKDTEERSQSADESITSINPIETSKNVCCEKYIKKYHSLQTKLALYKKRIEILESEKTNLRESLNQFQSSRNSPSKMDDQEFDSKKASDLESELERKKAFIIELKSELLKTCNALISKEEEIEKLTAKLSECETKSKSPTFEMLENSRVDSKTVDTHVKNLKNYKWELIQTIFDIQRKFYEKRGIHLNYFDKFKDHVNNLYSFHLTHPLAKSESLPLLNSYSMCQKQTDDRFKNLVGLELDIECLENLKIFLNRFFVPCVFETSHTFDSEHKKPSDSVREGKDTITSKQIVEAGVEKAEKQKITEFLDTLSCRYLSDFVPFFKKDFSENSYSLETFAMNVSTHLDFIENFFKAINECKGLNKFEFSSKDFEDKTEVKSLLQKMAKEISVLYSGGEKLFSLNGVLKHLDLFTLPLPKTASKQDISDRESVLSEETITISQSESPVSFEEICPIKLPYSETLKLEENIISSQPSEHARTVTEPQSVKMTAVGSSCDSVCHRSHYSSPDLGIESDPNHESSVPEQKETINKYQKLFLEEQKFIVKQQLKTAFTSTESAGRWKGTKFSGDTLYSIGNLPHYELLKREIQESLVGIKSVLSRTGDGLHHIGKYTSPRKTLEYSTLKAIKDTCVNVEICLKEAYKLVGEFWIGSCPSEQEWNTLIEENQTLYQQLTNLKNMMQQQENEFKKAMGKLEHAQILKANMEKKISKKLVKTKKVIRQAELKLLENKCQNFPPVPKFPLESSASNMQQDL